MGTIYQIVGDIRALSSLIESLVDEETGEAREMTEDEQKAFIEWVKEESEAFDVKFDRTCKYYRNLRATADACEAERKSHKDEMDRLSRRAKAKENAAGRVKDLLYFALDLLGKKKHETDLFSATIQNTAASVKTDSSFDILGLPTTYWKDPEFSSSSIKEGLTKGDLFQKPVSTKAEDIASGKFVSPVLAGSVFFVERKKDEDGKITETECMVPGLRFVQGSTLVVR